MARTTEISYPVVDDAGRRIRTIRATLRPAEPRRAEPDPPAPAGPPELVDPTWVEAHLEDAGKTLMRLPAVGCWPAGFRSAMPEIVREARAMDWAGELRLRLGPPSARQIARMEIATRWLLAVAAPPRRRVAALRMLVHPISERHLLPWPRVAALFDVHRTTVQRWHAEALAEIAGGLNRPDNPLEKFD